MTRQHLNTNLLQSMYIKYTIVNILVIDKDILNNRNHVILKSRQGMSLTTLFHSAVEFLILNGQKVLIYLL